MSPTWPMQYIYSTDFLLEELAMFSTPSFPERAATLRGHSEFFSQAVIILFSNTTLFTPRRRIGYRSYMKPCVDA